MPYISKSVKRTVSRILSSLLLTEAIMYLEIMLPLSSSGVPEQYVNYFIDKRTSNSLFIKLLSLFRLAPHGVCHAITVTCNAVSSYLTISPLLYVIHTAVSFLLHFPSAWIVANHHRLYVIKRVALWCSDFPHSIKNAIARSSHT